MYNWLAAWTFGSIGFVGLQEIAGLSVEPCEGETIMVCVFDIKKTEVLAFHIFQLFTLLTAIYLFNVRGEVRGTRYLSLTIIFFFFSNGDRFQHLLEESANIAS